MQDNRTMNYSDAITEYKNYGNELAKSTVALCLTSSDGTAFVTIPITFTEHKDGFYHTDKFKGVIERDGVISYLILIDAQNNPLRVFPVGPGFNFKIPYTEVERGWTIYSDPMTLRVE